MNAANASRRARASSGLEKRILVFFALGLSFWVGYTLATIQVEPFDEGEPPAAEEEPGPSDSSGS